MAKRICTYGISAALCITLGYLESLIPFDFIAPGIKLGLANSVALLLIYAGDIKGAAAVNAARIIISSLLFSGIQALPFSLAGAAGAWLVMVLLSRFKKLFGIAAVSAAGGAVHNIAQCAVAAAVVGKAVRVYMPLLLICGAVSGFLVGALSCFIIKKYDIKRIFKYTEESR